MGERTARDGFVRSGYGRVRRLGRVARTRYRIVDACGTLGVGPAARRHENPCRGGSHLCLPRRLGVVARSLPSMGTIPSQINATALNARRSQTCAIAGVQPDCPISPSSLGERRLQPAQGGLATSRPEKTTLATACCSPQCFNEAAWKTAVRAMGDAPCRVLAGHG